MTDLSLPANDQGVWKAIGGLIEVLKTAAVGASAAHPTLTFILVFIGIVLLIALVVCLVYLYCIYREREISRREVVKALQDVSKGSSEGARAGLATLKQIAGRIKA